MTAVTTSSLDEHLDEVVVETRRLRHRFAPTADRSWDAVTAAAEMCVQVGHLARCLGGVSGADDPERPIVHVGDELADIVLATCSITVLADTEPNRATPTGSMRSSGCADPVTAAFLNLVASAGALAEAALVATRHRHAPTGTPTLVAEAAGTVLDDCDGFASALGLDLVREFRAMVADADAFLDSRGVDR